MKQQESKPTDRVKAEQLEQLIEARQSGQNRPSTFLIDPADAEFAEQLFDLAESVQPKPEFQAELEKSLAQMAGQRATSSMPSISNMLRQLTLGLQTFSFSLHRQWLVAGGAAMLLLVGLLITMPTTRAALKNMLYGFAFIEEKRVTDTAIEIVKPIIVPNATPALSLTELHRDAPFNVRVPTWLPSDLHFTGGSIVDTSDGTQLALVYHPSTEVPEPNAPSLLLVVTQGTPSLSPTFPTAQETWVGINGQPAIYIRGSWRGHAPSQAERTLDGVYWDENVDVAWLSWQEGMLTYLLQADELSLGQDEMIQIAESLE